MPMRGTPATRARHEDWPTEDKLALIAMCRETPTRTFKAMGATFAPPRSSASCYAMAREMGLVGRTGGVPILGAMPQGADDDALVARLVAEGGFPRLSERRGANGHPVACLPLVWDCRPGGRLAPQGARP